MAKATLAGLRQLAAAAESLRCPAQTPPVVVQNAIEEQVFLSVEIHCTLGEPTWSCPSALVEVSDASPFFRWPRPVPNVHQCQSQAVCEKAAPMEQSQSLLLHRKWVCPREATAGLAAPKPRSQQCQHCLVLGRLPTSHRLC